MKKPNVKKKSMLVIIASIISAVAGIILYNIMYHSTDTRASRTRNRHINVKHGEIRIGSSWIHSTHYLIPRWRRYRIAILQSKSSIPSNKPNSSNNNLGDLNAGNNRPGTPSNHRRFRSSSVNPYRNYERIPPIDPPKK